jgi:hypothetical protein
MRLTVTFFLILSTLLSQSQAQTVIPPGDVSGTWAVAGSPYLIQGNIQIPNNLTLNIEPGVTVEFQGHYSLNVQGRLLAMGTEIDTIVFTVSDTTGFSDPDTVLGGWYGIRFIDTPTQNDTSKISYCKLQYGKAVGTVWHANAGGAICVIQFEKVIISHCLFVNNSAGGPINEGPSGGAIHFAFSDITLIENTFKYNCAHLGGAIHFHESSPNLVNNTIEFNRAYQGGGIVVQGDCQPTFNQDVIRYNHADDRGGGMVCWSPSISTLNQVAITNNTAWWGGGMGVYDAETFLNNCEVSYNHAENLGGGIHADFSTLHLYQTTFRRDTCDSGSGGLHAWYCEVDADLCQFTENMAINGGAFHSDFSQVEIGRSTFSRNIATNGAGIDAYCIDLVLDSCDFIQNVAYNAAASIQYNADTTEFSQPYQVALTRNRFELNYTPNLVAGITINQVNSDSSLVDLLVDNCIFASNSADHAASFRIMGSIHNFIVSNSIFTGNDALRWAAGPFLIVNCQGQFINCLFNSNQASVGGGTSSGGGAALSQEAKVDFLNCTFVNNSSGFGGGLDIRTGGTSCVMNSIFWENTNQQISITTTDSRISSLTINHCNIQHGLDSIGVDTSSVFHWGDGNMDTDPLFVHPGGADYHLQDASPCIGAGIDSLEIAGFWYVCPTTDLEGNPRPNPAGSMPDMGVYESPLATPLGIVDTGYQKPEEFLLMQNYPNPFNASTEIEFRIPTSTFVTLKIYNILGEEVATLLAGQLHSGSHQYQWDASQEPSGLYFYKLTAANFIQVKMMLIVK